MPNPVNSAVQITSRMDQITTDLINRKHMDMEAEMKIKG
jgi:hypothetical protein